MVYWKCPACTLEAKNEKEKMEHIKDTVGDRAHEGLLKEKTEVPQDDVSGNMKD